MCSFIVENLGGFCPFWYLTLYLGDRYSMESSLVGAEGSDRASELDSKVGSSVFFSLGGPGSVVGSAELGLIMDSSFLESYG